MLENVPSSSRYIVVQADEDGVNIGDQVKPMEGNNVDNTTENDGINRLIHDTFSPMYDIFDGIRDVPLIDKSQTTLYKGSRTNLLSTINLLMNLKVLNGLPNTCLRWNLRYVI